LVPSISGDFRLEIPKFNFSKSTASQPCQWYFSRHANNAIRTGPSQESTEPIPTKQLQGALSALRKPIENRSSDRSKAAGLIHLTDWIRSSCGPLTAAFEKRQMASCVDNCFPNSPCGKQVVIPLNDWNIIDTPKAMSTKFHEEMASLSQAFSLFHGLRRRGKSGKI
jgi:hypothetical protein